MQTDDTIRDQPKTLTDQIRERFGGLLDPIAGFLNRIGLYPNTVTLIGLAGNVLAAYFLAIGSFFAGGLLVLLTGPIDALDGAMARLRGEPTNFGAFVDSVTDRYSELIVLGGLIAYYLLNANPLWAGMAYVAAVGSVLVSYIRARAESLGYKPKGGLLTRMERYFVLVPSLIFGHPAIGIAIIAVLANITALQRIIFVRRIARTPSDSKK